MSGNELQGVDIGRLLRSKGPTVTCVLLKAGIGGEGNEQKKGKKEKKETETRPDSATEGKDVVSTDAGGDTSHQERIVLKDAIEQIQVDTTPQKSMVQKILGGPFTFLGQYEEEGIMLMIRKPIDGDVEDQRIPLNHHQLQPPFDQASVRGDILVMKVAPTDEVLDDDVANDSNNDKSGTTKPVEMMSNEEFFLNYSKDEYVAFASRTDVVPPAPPEGVEDGEEEGDVENEEEAEDYDAAEGDEDDDDDEEESPIAVMNLIMREILRKFTEDKGRGPSTEELLTLRAAVAVKMGIELPEITSEDDDCDKEQSEEPGVEKKVVVVENKDGVNDETDNNESNEKKRTLSSRNNNNDGTDGVNDETKGPGAKRVKFDASIIAAPQEGKVNG